LTVEIHFLAAFAVLLALITSFGLLITNDWRISLGLLALQYVVVFILTSMQWSISMSLTKLIAGWMAAAVLGIAVIGAPELQTQIIREADMMSSLPGAGRLKVVPFLRNRMFSLFAAILISGAVFAGAATMKSMLPGIALEQAVGGLLLVGIGLLKLGFTIRPFPTTLGLLTALAGFEILYSTIQASILVAGLLAGMNLIVALAGSYLLAAPTLENEAP
jgi:hypothetical protein